MRVAIRLGAIALFAPPLLAADDPSGAVPKGDPGGWIDPMDYPRSALREVAEGIVAFKLTIDPQGVPTACEVTRSSGRQDLDDTACRLLVERARFDPARDATGQPTQGTYQSRVSWTMPRMRPVPRAGAISATMVIETDGQVSSCSVDRAEGPQPATAQAICARPPTFEPPVDADGNPVRKRVRQIIETVVEDFPSETGQEEPHSE